MEEMLKLLVQGLVSEPDKVEINLRKDGNTNVLEVRVASDDMGKIIGKQGKIAKAIRTLMKAYGAKFGEKINVDIID